MAQLLAIFRPFARTICKPNCLFTSFLSFWLWKPLLRWCKAHAMQNQKPLDIESLYRRALFVRRFEEGLAKAHDAGHVPGLLHLCIGAEIAEALLCHSLDSTRDQVTGSHRSHGLALLMGACPNTIAKEILGRVGGLSNGMGGTQHLLAPEHGFLTSNGIVGAQVPIALGAALSAKTRGDGGIGVAVFGDGAANQGAVLESLNLAAALKLPMMFFMENNGVAQSTSSTFALPGGTMVERATAFGLEANKIEPQDYQNAADLLHTAVAKARSGVPVFVEAKTVRLSGHYYGDTSDQKRQEKDPILRLRSHLKHQGLCEKTLKAVEDECDRDARSALGAAINAPKAGASELAQANRLNLEAPA